MAILYIDANVDGSGMTRPDADKDCLKCGKPKNNGCECWVWK